MRSLTIVRWPWNRPCLQSHTPVLPQTTNQPKSKSIFQDSYQHLPFVIQGWKTERELGSKATFIITVISYRRYGYCSQFLLQLKLNVQPCDERYNEIFNRGLHLSVWQKKFSWGTMNCYLFPFQFSKGCPTQLWNNFTLFKCISFELKQ